MTAFTAAEVAGHVAMPLLGQEERFRVRVEPCVCRGMIVASDDPATWPEAVARHNRSLAHLLWWTRTRDDWQGERP